MIVEKKVFILNQKVINPRPDRRLKNSVWAEEEWPVDSLWLRTVRQEALGCGQPKPPTMYLRIIWEMAGKHSSIEHETPQVLALQPHLQEFDWDTSDRRLLFQGMKLRSNFNDGDVLRWLFIFGRLSVGQLGTAIQGVDAMDETEYRKL
jgi:hypothetical protein